MRQLRFLVLSVALGACNTHTAAPTDSEDDLGALLATIDGREWDGLAGPGDRAAVPVRGSTACKTERIGYRCSMVDTVGEGEDAISVALVLTFREEKGRLAGTLEDLGPSGRTLVSAPVAGSRRGRTLSFVTTETVTEGGMTGLAFLDLELESASPRFAFGVQKSPAVKVTIIAGTFR